MKKHAYTVRTIASIIVLVLSILAFLGISYQAKVFDFQIFSLIQRNIISFSIFSCILLVFILIMSFLGGRIYCSLLCPLGIMQELAFRIGKKIKKRKGSYTKGNIWKYIIASIFWGMMFGGSVFLSRWLDPYATFGGAFTLSFVGIALTIVVVLYSFFKDRFFCHSICPAGTLIGLISSISPFKMHMNEKCISCGKCERECPASCIDSKGKVIDSDRCLLCLSCISSCPKDAISFGKIDNMTFKPERRKFIAGISSAIVLGASFVAGKVLEKQSSSKKYDIIIPPGAGEPSRLLSKCMNCNLCVAVCPSKIIKKADSSYGAVSIDYRSGACNYNCNSCMDVCPSGAIVRMPLEDKKNLRIAMAVIQKDECMHCNSCIAACPRNAIHKRDNGLMIDGINCIGCGSCVKACSFGAIKIFAVKKQKII